MRFPRCTWLLAFLLHSHISFSQRMPEPVSSGSQGALSSSWVDSTLSSMTLEEKVGQLIMARTFGHFISTSSEQYGRLVDLVEQQHVGGLVVFQGDVYETAILLNRLQQQARIPLLVASDFERGIAMRIRRGTYFPDAMAIGATRDPHYAYEVGKTIAREARAIGIHMNLAPVADVNNNPENPVINTRSFGESPDLVGGMVEAFVRGTRDGGAVATVKHFPGHGDTGTDSHLSLPVLSFDRERLEQVEFPSFRRAIRAGVGSVMIAHLSVPSIDSTGRPATLSPVVVSNVLRKELGFDGLIVTDAMEMRGLLNSYSVGESAVMALQAGVDVILLPADEVLASEAILHAVETGNLTVQRIEESVRRILDMKSRLGLPRKRTVDLDSIAENVESEAHLVLAREVARHGITLVKNDGVLLPLYKPETLRIAVTALGDTEEGKTEVNRPSYQYPIEPYGDYFVQQFRKRARVALYHRIDPGTSEDDIRSVLDKLRQTDVIIVPVFAKVRSASGQIGLPERVESFVSGLSALSKPVVVIAFGNPYTIGEFSQAGALLCAYSDAEVMTEAAVEALFGEISITATLPVTIPDRFPAGQGIVLHQTSLRRDLPLSAGFDRERLNAVDTLITHAISDSAFPGAQVAVARDGALVYEKSFGTLSYDPTSPQVTRSTLYDLASLTKVVATTAAVMKLYDEGKISLDDEVREYLPQFEGGAKDEVTVEQLLTHRSGLPPYRDFFRITTSPTQALDSLYATPLAAKPGDTTMYSDLGMMLLGKVVENVSGLPLDSYMKREFFDPLGMSNTMFNPPPALKERIAPTESGTVQGTVHDENARLFGGVSGHAGLFSTASDLAVFMQMIMNGGTYGGRRYFSESTVQTFIHRKGRVDGRALGWDIRSSEHSSAGKLFSLSSFGHTGFTGTSIWADPERHLFVIFLSNRIHPSRENKKIFQVRPALHDAVINALLSPPS